MKRTNVVLMAVCCLVGLTSAAGASELASPLKLSDGVSGFKLEDFTLKFHMRLQGWGGYVGEDALLSNGDLMQESGFRMRRARLGIDGQFFNGLNYNLELDLFDQERNGGPLYEAYVTYNPIPLFGARLGVQKYLFVKSQMMSSGFLPFLDRPMGSDAMSPNNSMGLVLFTQPWTDHLTITAGVFNGLHRTDNFHGGYDGVGVSLGNRFEGLSYAGRLDLEPLAKVGRGLADLAQSGEFRLGVGGSGFFNDGRSIQTLGYSGYLHLKYLGIHLFGEYIADEVEPQDKPTSSTTVNAKMNRWVANASLGYIVLKNTLGVAVRFEMLDSNVDIDDEGDEWAVTGTVTWYIVGDFLKAQVEYTHRQELNGLTYNNDSAMAGVQIMF